MSQVEVSFSPLSDSSLNQDSFVGKPKDSDEALLVYTNANPGNGAPYGSTESIGRFTTKSGGRLLFHVRG